MASARVAHQVGLLLHDLEQARDSPQGPVVAALRPRHQPLEPAAAAQMVVEHGRRRPLMGVSDGLPDLPDHALQTGACPLVETEQSGLLDELGDHVPEAAVTSARPSRRCGVRSSPPSAVRFGGHERVQVLGRTRGGDASASGSGRRGPRGGRAGRRHPEKRGDAQHVKAGQDGGSVGVGAHEHGQRSRRLAARRADA